MTLASIVKLALEQRATDIHLEPAMNVVILSQKMMFREDQNLMVPTLEILMGFTRGEKRDSQR